VIAREWRRLEPVRAYAESRGIPVELASDAPLSLWKMREMQAFVRALLADRTRLMSVGDLTQVLNALPRNRWTGMIGEGIGLLARDVAEKAIPVPDIVEWFGEWSRDARGEQRGLLLLTAHRAKGLEFDHVAILDGGWDRTSRGEDPDAPRRLFYVAMTRARRTLTLMAQGRHALLDPGGGEAVLVRRGAVGEVLPVVQRHVAAEARLVDLSWAGRLPDGAPSLAAIARAQVGDPVRLERRGKDWLVMNAEGVVLSRMARAFAPPDGAMDSGVIGAILTRRLEDSEEDYRAALRREEWEVVLPEFVFAPGKS
jgi:ATP-dependent DNA helicase RecQ